MLRQDLPLAPTSWDSTVSHRNLSNSSHDDFPLPDGYFPKVHLTTEKVVKYEMQMREIVNHALAEYELHEARNKTSVYQTSWSVVGKVGNLTTVKKETPNNPAFSISRIFGRVNGSSHHFIDFFYAETSAQLFAWNQFMFGYAVDAAVLKNIYTVASKNDCLYMGIKWTCLNPSFKKRDHCYMEYLTYTKDLRGRDVGVRVTLSLDIPECPKLPKKLKSKRMRLKTVWIFRPTEQKSNTTDVFMMFQNESDGVVNTAGYYKRMMKIFLNIAIFVDSRRILMQGLMYRKSWVKAGSRKHCSVCSRQFGPLRRCHHCRLCGDLICRSCAVLRDAPKEMKTGSASARSTRTFKTVKTKFCLLCLTNLRGSRMNVLVPVPTTGGGLSEVEYNHEALKLSELCHSALTETESEGEHVHAYFETDRSEGARIPHFAPLSTLLDSHASTRRKRGLLNDQTDNILGDARMTIEELNEEEVMEITETTNMALIGLSNAPERCESLSRVNEADSAWLPYDSKTSSRTLDQCLAEQKELLFRMMLSASGLRQQKTQEFQNCGQE